MSRIAKLTGFDYRVEREVERTTAEWRAELLEIVKSGGFRRQENGETFAHGKDGRIVFEVYGSVRT